LEGFPAECREKDWRMPIFCLDWEPPSGGRTLSPVPAIDASKEPGRA
jgi:hypothetical protein